MGNSKKAECECLRQFIASHENELQEVGDKNLIIAIENIADLLHDKIAKQQLKKIEKNCQL